MLDEPFAFEGVYDNSTVAQFVSNRLVTGRGPGVEVLDPASEEVIARVAGASEADVEAALASAHSAFSVWRFVSPQERARILSGAARLLAERSDQLAAMLSYEQGKTLADARMELAGTAEIFEWYAGEALRIEGRLLSPRARNIEQLVVPEPIGIVAAFVPWNFPVQLAAKKVAPALAVGCSCILKVPEEAPGAVLGIALALRDAGLPDGVLNVVFGDAPAIARQVIAYPGVRAVTFTGSTHIGRAIAGLAAEALKPVTLELGGHAPVVILEDADLDHTVETAVAAKIRNAGQVCTSPTRFFVHRAIHDAMVDRLAESFAAVRIGAGLNPASQMGPLAHPRRLQAASRLVDDARTRGATVASGGKRHGNRGYFFEPTILTNVPGEALVQTEEPFCPIITVEPFDRIDTALDRANAVESGLAGYVFSSDSAAAADVARALEVGQVGINSCAVSQVEAPFGGVKESGYGREGGRDAVREFLTLKYINHVHVRKSGNGQPGRSS